MSFGYVHFLKRGRPGIQAVQYGINMNFEGSSSQIITHSGLCVVCMMHTPGPNQMTSQRRNRAMSKRVELREHLARSCTNTNDRQTFSWSKGKRNTLAGRGNAMQWCKYTSLGCWRRVRMCADGPSKMSRSYGFWPPWADLRGSLAAEKNAKNRKLTGKNSDIRICCSNKVIRKSHVFDIPPYSRHSSSPHVCRYMHMLVR